MPPNAKVRASAAVARLSALLVADMGTYPFRMLEANIWSDSTDYFLQN
jgi:hypothetical protein